MKRMERILRIHSVWRSRSSTSRRADPNDPFDPQHPNTFA